jgi:hypothetical protein
VLVVEPNRYPGSFTLRSLAWGDGQAIEDYNLSGNRLEIPLPQPLLSGERLDLALLFDLTLPAIPDPSEATRPVPYGYTSRQTNLVDWYPFLPPYRPGVGWLWRDAWFFGEHQVYETANYEVAVTLAQPVDGLVLAASSPAVQDGLTYRYTFEQARNFVWSASQQYQVLSQQVGDVTVFSYHFPYHTAGGRPCSSTPPRPGALQRAVRPLPAQHLERGRGRFPGWDGVRWAVFPQPRLL